MICHCPQRKIINLVLTINDSIIKCVKNFDLLLNTLNQHMNWKTDIN